MSQNNPQHPSPREIGHALGKLSNFGTFEEVGLRILLGSSWAPKWWDDFSKIEELKRQHAKLAEKKRISD